MNATNPSRSDAPLILLTGATGYVGGRLLQLLESGDHRIRCIARRPEVLAQRVHASTEVVAGDVLDRSTLAAAMHGVHTAYYMVHSMGSDDSFEQVDRQAAHNFIDAAHAAGVQRVIYLGGLASDTEKLSPHLASRREVGEILRKTTVQVTEFRASIIIGSGSLSFEMIRSLVDRLPIMVTPKWVKMPAQPIAIDDVLSYLLAALSQPVGPSRIFEIGGADMMSYADIMRVYAKQRGMKRRMISVPVLTPFLSGLWLGFITPLYARIGRKLIASIVHSTVVRDNSALSAFDIRPIGVDEAVHRALDSDEERFATTRWSDALSSSGAIKSWGGVKFDSRVVDSRAMDVNVPREVAFGVVERIGGDNGWYAWNWLWKVRGAMDLLVGGVGVRRGRPSPTTLRVGDALDFWRVEVIEPHRRLRLLAEMKLPGRAWLEFEVTGDGASCNIRQTAIFDPVGLMGLLYWYGIYPLHKVIFHDMLRAIANAALEQAKLATDRGGEH